MPAFQSGSGNLSSASSMPANVHFAPPSNSSNNNPKYRFRIVLNGNPSQYWVKKGEEYATLNVSESHVSSASDSARVTGIGRYEVLPELVEEN